MQFIAVFKSLLFICISYHLKAYIPSHLDMFLKNQTCEKGDLTRSILKFKSLSNPSIHQCYLTNAKIQASDFSHLNISESNGIRLQITNSNCNQCFWDQLLLTYSMIENISIKNSHFSNIEWDKSQVLTSDFENCQFDNINFQNSDLSSSKFSNNHFANTYFFQSDLRGVDFHDSQFLNTSFKDADLRGANLYHTNITLQQLNEALSYLCAILPNGTVYDNHGKEAC